MSSWLIAILVIAAITIVVIFSLKRKPETQDDPESSKRSCKTCENTIPQDFSKSLCPHCRAFLT
jgi:Zn finger protein HypA/HybF involved in hydrogenase expression